MRFIDKTNRLLDWDAYIAQSKPTKWDLLEDTELDITSHLATFPIFYSMVKNLWGIA